MSAAVEFATLADALRCGRPRCPCQRIGTSRVVHCPAHDDAKPSLSLSQHEGQILFHCHRGCSQEAVLDALRARGLWGQDRAAMREIMATFDYRDEHGDLVFQVVRFAPKDFRQRRPAGAGKWVWNLDGVRRVPYRLRETLAAILRGERIFIVEGEKDADRLASAGLAASTNPGGAGKWRSEYGQHFKGARVGILPDNDDPGRRHAEQVARSLHGIAAEVKVIALPGLPPKSDVSDWLAAGHSLAELQRLVEDARPWRPPSQDIPEEGYIGIAVDFADLYATHTESPRSFLYVTFLAYLGGLIGHRVTLESELHPAPRLYVVNLGASADTRKSSSLDHVDRFFRNSVSNFGEYVHYGLGSIEGLARRLGRDPETKQMRPLILHLDELRVLVDKARPEGSIILPMLASLFDKTVFDNSTKTHSISVRDGYLSLVSACTLETYSAMWTPAFLALGFTNRLWLVTGEPDHRVALPKPIPDYLRQAIAKALGELLVHIDYAAGAGQLALRLDDEAGQVWDAWYATMPRTIHSRRLDAYGWRLMILLSLSRGDLKIVSADTVRRVCALLDHQLALRQQFDPIDAETNVAKMEEAIRRVLRTKGPLNKRDLRRFVHESRYGLWTFEQALSNVKQAGDVGYDKAGKRFFLSAADEA